MIKSQYKGASATRVKWAAIGLVGLLGSLLCGAHTAALAGKPENSPSMTSSTTTEWELGRRIYREGILPSGQAITGVIQGDVPLNAEQIVCESCHRRSGLSSSEGGIFVPPVSGTILYQPREVKRKELWASKQEGPGTRPAYTDETLVRAIRDGVDSADRPLDALMPRYALSDEALKPLIAYLKTLSAEPSPGVTETDIHFATVVTEGVDPAQRQAMLTVLETYLRDKNAGTRHETGRSQRAPWHKDWVYQAYRKWVLHVWELSGPEETWGKQLETYYRQQPVFAMLSGISTGSWLPVHAYCEASELPCLFPNTDLPGLSDEDFYSIYFSKGLTLEAEVLARHLSTQQGSPPAGPIVQVFREGTAGEVAATAFRRASQRLEIEGLQDQAVDADTSITTAFWRDLWQRKGPSLLVLWLGAEDLSGLEVLQELTPPSKGVYLSATLAMDAEALAPTPLRDRLYLVYPFELPEAREGKLVRTNAWLRARKIEMPDEQRIQANTYYAVTMAGSALKHIIDNFSREYFIERIEHKVDNSLTSSVYPHVSLAPKQRFISKGAYIVQLPDNNSGGVLPVTDWIVP